MSFWIKINPFDTLFFRTPRPFSMGVDSWAEFIFPPYPSTLYGAIRSFLIFKKGKLSEFYSGKIKDEAIGTPEEKGKLKIKGPFVLKGEHPIFGAPMDLVSIKGEKNKKARQLKRKVKPSLIVSNYELEDVLMWKGKEAVEQGGDWLKCTEFRNYIKAKKEEFDVLEEKEIFLREPKIGIKIDRKTLTSEEDKLYRIHMIRLKEGVSIIAEISGTESFPQNGVFQLGGEGKGVFFEVVDDPLTELKSMSFSFESKIFKLYLATPAIFKNGWIPSWIDPDTFEGEKNNIKVKLVACAIGRSVPIGGWDLAKGKAKTLRRAIPAGSVYYFKIQDSSSPEDIIETFHVKNISDYNSEEGFGLAIVGED